MNKKFQQAWLYSRIIFCLAACTVSFGADRSERSEDKKGTKNFWHGQIFSRKNLQIVPLW